MSRTRRSAQTLSRGALSSLLAIWTLLLAPAVHAADWIYTVRPDDRLWNLAEKYCGSHSRWHDLAKHNQLPQATELQPGTQLRIPMEWLVQQPAVVKIVYARGDVQIVNGANESVAVAGRELTVGTRVVTGNHSYANVLFADGSGMQIGPDSDIAFDTLSAFKDTGMVDSQIRINRGEGASEVKPQRGPGSVYRISTPLGVAAVRGTEFRTRADGNTSFVETTGGAVEFIGAAESRAVDSGFGLKADPNGVFVEALLPPPDLAQRSTYGTGDSISWQALTGATEYLVQIYADADAKEVLQQIKVPKPEYQLAGLSEGTYVYGVRGIAASGLQGAEAAGKIEVVSSFAAPADVRGRQPWLTRDLLVSWQAVPEATGYRVTATPRSGGSKMVLEVTDTSARFQNLAIGGWDVGVQALSDDAESAPAVANSGVRRRMIWLLGAAVVAGLIAL